MKELSFEDEYEDTIKMLSELTKTLGEEALSVVKNPEQKEKIQTFLNELSKSEKELEI